MACRGKMRDRPQRVSHFEVEVPLQLLNPGSPAYTPRPHGYRFVDVRIPDTRHPNLRYELPELDTNFPLPQSSTRHNEFKRSAFSSETRRLLREVHRIKVQHQRRLKDPLNSCDKEDNSSDKENHSSALTTSTPSTSIDVTSRMSYSDKISKEEFISERHGIKRKIVVFSGSSKSSVSHSMITTASSEKRRKVSPPNKKVKDESGRVGHNHFGLTETAVQTEDWNSVVTGTASGLQRRTKIKRTLSAEPRKPTKILIKQRSKSVENPDKNCSENRKLLRERRKSEKPWRENMRTKPIPVLATNVNKIGIENNEKEAETSEWKFAETISKKESNHISIAGEGQQQKEDKESTKKKPWRCNMKKKKEINGSARTSEPEVKNEKKFDVEQVRNYMEQKREADLCKRKKEKMEEERRRKEIKNRLQNLEEKHEKEIKKAKCSKKSEPKREYIDVALNQRKLREEMLLRQKLEELTREMRMKKQSTSIEAKPIRPKASVASGDEKIIVARNVSSDQYGSIEDSTKVRTSGPNIAFEIPERDNNVVSKDNCDKLCVDSILARHRTDLEFVKNLNLDLDMASSLSQLDSKVRTAAISSSARIKSPVPVNQDPSSHNFSCPGTEEEDAMPPLIQYSDLKSNPELAMSPKFDVDPLNIMSSYRKKMKGKDLTDVAKSSMEVVDKSSLIDEELSGTTISEGPLSTSVAFTSNNPTPTPVHDSNKNEQTAYVLNREKSTNDNSDENIGAALRLRFLSEINQLENIEETEKHLMYLKNLNDFSNMNLRQASLGEQKQMKRAEKPIESKAEFEQRIKAEFQNILTSKMTSLMEKQTEATKMTAEATKHLARLQLSNEGQKAKSKKKQKKEIFIDNKSSKSINNSKSSHSQMTLEDNLVSLMTRTESEIPEMLNLIDRTEKSVETLPKTISDAIETLTSKNVDSRVSDVTEDISFSEYSSRFEGTEKHTGSARSQTVDYSEALNASPPTADKFLSGSNRLLQQAPSNSSLSLLSESGDAFNRFSMQMFQQHLQDESVRAKHQYVLLKKKENLLIDKVKRELATLQKRKKECKEKSDVEKVASIRKKERAILLQLKVRRGEISRLKEGLKVAEKERKMILNQQKSLYNDDDDTQSTLNGIDSSRSVDEESTTLVENVEEKSTCSDGTISTSSHKHSSSSYNYNQPKNLKLAKRQILQGLRKLQNNKKMLGEKENEFYKKVKELGEMIDLNLTDESDPSCSRQSDHEKVVVATNVSTSPSKMESLKKSIGATLKTPLSPKLSGRRRHSSADSDESLSVSQAEISDHSDVEIRVNALKNELKGRMIIAAQLKRQQRNKNKEKLKVKEDALKQQIEKYDELIKETKDHLQETIESPVIVQPQIKTPKLSLVDTASRKSSLEDIAPSTSSLSKQESITENPEEVTDNSLQSLSVASSATTVVTSPKILPSQKNNPLQSELNVKTVGESPLSATKDLSDQDASDLNYSDDFTSSNAVSVSSSFSEGNEIETQVEKPTALMSDNKLEEDHKEPAKSEESLSGKISDAIVNSLVTDTFETLKLLMNDEKHKHVDVPPVEHAKDSKRPGLQSGLGSTPAGLMLTTFDISSESSDEDQRPQNVPPKSDCSNQDQDTSSDDPNDEGMFDDHNFIDDDFGLSSIRKESEHIRQQQLLIEQEIQRIQQESQGRKIPNKPPPPYSPPATPSKILKLASEKVIEKFVPSEREEIVLLSGIIANSVFESKVNGVENELDTDDLVAKINVKDEEQLASVRTFLAFMLDLVTEIIGEILPTNLRQNTESLKKLVEKEVLIHFGFEKRARRENLIVRWSQKKRDRVDQILVRELHAEEASWTDYRADEQRVKEELVNSIFELLMKDTVSSAAQCISN